MEMKRNIDENANEINSAIQTQELLRSELKQRRPYFDSVAHCLFVPFVYIHFGNHSESEKDLL